MGSCYEMLVKLVVFAATWTLCTSSELYDVTTIYRIDEPAGGIEHDESPMSAEIHARTNALGLPFLVAGNVVEPEVGVDIPRCVALRLSDVRCDWELDNWDWTVWEHAPLLDTGDWSELQVTGLASKYLRFDDALFIRFNGLVHNQSYIHVVFTPSRAYIQNQEKFYYLQLSKLHQSFFHRCDNRIFERFTRFKDLDENIIAIHCHKIANVTLQMEKWSFGKVNAENYLLVEINKNGTIQLWNTKARTVPMMMWVDPQPIPINFFTIRTDEAGNAQVSAINYGKGQVLSMAKNVNIASITSPPLGLASNKLCVSLVYHTQRSTTPTVVTVASNTQTVNLGELRNDQDGWKVDRFKVTLPESMLEEEVKVHIKSIKNEGDLHIQRIAGCNADDDEDIATISVLGGFSTPNDRMAYSVAVRPSAGSFHNPKFITVGDCENGGLVYSEGKCACPAGFTGDRCQTGCGANRYGLDCGGLCSLRQQECRGLTLCTPIVGCFCAPGYKGYHCNQTCEGRQYGAGCTQRCNNCAGRCDPYTGVCTTVCKPGYYPPYCKTVYSYTQFAPQVNVSTYGEATVTPDIYNTLGQGKPAFYQVQYKVSRALQSIVYRTLPISQTGDSVQDVVITGLQHGVRYDVRVILIDQDLNSYQGNLVPYNQFLTSCYVPEDYDYKPKAETTATSITMSWRYEPDHEYSCPVVNYELSWQEGWRWLSLNVTNTTATLVNKLPVTAYNLRVRALTSSDYAPYSNTISVRTAKQAPGPIWNLTLVQSTSSSLTLSWNPPLDKDHYNISYIVTYECKKLTVCERESTETGEAHVVQPVVTLQGLQPLAQYVVTCKKLTVCERESTETGEAHVVQPVVTLQGLQPLAQYVVTCKKLTVCERESTETGEAHVVQPVVTLQGLQPLAQYVVTCKKLTVCERESTETGEAHVVQPVVTLQGLQPLAQYVVTVSAVDAAAGPNVSVVVCVVQEADSV
ncbi:uncharacterized protein LOC129003313 [Macrosteles quadrilineatus]|uniref:uncharacterized protein LOC129003313 n=1 Tax=Macrosteles quadrilineatus TaxID=74068 RepID=UPI0023E13AE9|nr:uncharacterized protein LOC129003313 [Macrosteles quadrilineatus]